MMFEFSTTTMCIPQDPQFEQLSQRGLTTKQVADTILKTITMAELLCKRRNNSCEPVALNGGIRVILPSSYSKGWMLCEFCGHTTNAPGEIAIEKINTKARIRFDEHSFHQLRHAYFGEGKYRIDPLVAADILGL